MWVLLVSSLFLLGSAMWGEKSRELNSTRNLNRKATVAMKSITLKKE